jgi:Flp pilus assembly protein TadG
VSAHADRARRQAGQATVEVALVVPLVALLALGVVQVGVLVHDQLLVTAAAREAVRAAAVSSDDAGARRAAGSVGRLDPGRLRVDVSRGAGESGLVEARVSYTALTRVPVVGALLPDVSLSAEAVMRSEL